MEEKSASYTKDDVDVLANFKRQAQRWGLNDLLVWGIYWGKQVDAAETTICRLTDILEQEGTTLEYMERDPDLWDHVMLRLQAECVSGEGIRSRLDDIRNYADLLECRLTELGII